jgi:hypothetical protein
VTRRLLLFLVITMACMLLSGMRRPLPPLEERSVVRFNESVCGPDASYVLEWTQGEAWQELAWGNKRPAPGDCVAYAMIEPPAIRACCVWESRRECLPSASHIGPIHCPTIWHWETGRRYGASRVEAWNAAHAGD